MTIKNALRISLILLFNMTYCIRLNAQEPSKENDKSQLSSFTKAKYYLAGLGLEREQKIATSATLYFGVAIESVVPFYPRQPNGYSDILSIEQSINFAPVFYGGFKNYYNLRNRQKNGKKTANNSASFFGMEYEVIAPILINRRYKTNYLSSFSPTWGFQKNISEHVNLELMAGPSFQTDFNVSRISGFAKFGFNYAL